MPLGVIGIIFESRPNVTADAGALCVKSGNAAILRGGSDSFYSSRAIWQCLVMGLTKAGLPEKTIQLVPTTDRTAVGELLKMSNTIDIIVPRGGKSLIERVQAESRIPVIAHLEGLCHTYIDRHADLNMAKEIIDKGIKGKLEEIYGIETTLHYPEKYAGTADLVGVYQGKQSIIDFKQSNKPKKVDYIQDYFLQLGAYTLAHNVVYDSNITSGVILLCTVDNLFQDFKIEGPELLMYQNLFLGRLKKFNEMNNLS